MHFLEEKSWMYPSLLKTGQIFYFFINSKHCASDWSSIRNTPPPLFQPRLSDSLHNYPPPLLMISSCFPAASAAVTFTAAGTGGFEIHSDAAALRTSRPRLASHLERGGRAGVGAWGGALTSASFGILTGSNHTVTTLICLLPHELADVSN